MIPRQPLSAGPIAISDEVMRAQARGAPIVALETAVLTHGLPRIPWTTLALEWPGLLHAPAWLNADLAVNFAAMEAMIQAVINEGAVPAVTAVVDGVVRLGVSESELDTLSESLSARKVARRDLASAIVSRAWGGTTVSAAIAIAHAGGVPVFATGGIGGVHRGWQQSPDISADLLALAHHSVCVVSSGAKSILDIPATLESLETLSIPVVGYRCSAFPRFVCESDPTLLLPCRADDEDAVARIAQAHWSLPAGGAILVVQPVNQAVALASEIAERAQNAAESSSSARGAAATPELLGRVASLTGGASLRANITLLRDNAALAARIAVSMNSSSNA